jgi:hypothetical protein
MSVKSQSKSTACLVSVRTLRLPRDYQVCDMSHRPAQKVRADRPFRVVDRTLPSFRFVWRGVLRSYGVLVGALHRARARLVTREAKRDLGTQLRFVRRDQVESSTPRTIYYFRACAYSVERAPKLDSEVAFAHPYTWDSENRRYRTAEEVRKQHPSFRVVDWRLRCQHVRRVDDVKVCKHVPWRVCSPRSHTWTGDTGSLNPYPRVEGIVSSCTSCGLVEVRNQLYSWGS